MTQAPYANVNGVQIISARITFPSFGPWHGDLALSLANDVSGRILISVGDLVLSGFAFRSAPFAGMRGVRFIGGAGGWQREVAPQTYQSPNAITVGQVIGDAATNVGEKVSLDNPSQIVGDFFIRERCKASRVLRQLLGNAWWIDLDGTTRNHVRDASAITSHFEIVEYTPNVGRFVVATETLGDWMPGRTFSSPVVPTIQTISSSTLILDNKGTARFEVLTNTVDTNAGDRLYEDLEELIRENFPALTFLGRYEYSVSGVHGDHVDASPTDTVLGLPPITLLPETFPLMAATLSGGDLIRVMFVNGNPTRPEVVSAPRTSPTIKVGNDGPSAARVGDNVNDGYLVLADPSTAPNGQVDSYYPGTPAGLSSANSRVTTIQGMGGTAAVLPMVNGKIDSGSGQVRVG